MYMYYSQSISKSCLFQSTIISKHRIKAWSELFSTADQWDKPMEISGKINGRLGCENLRKVFTPPSIELGGVKKNSVLYEIFPRRSVLHHDDRVAKSGQVGYSFRLGPGDQNIHPDLRIPQMKHQVVQQNESPRNITNTIHSHRIPILPSPRTFTNIFHTRLRHLLIEIHTLKLHGTEKISETYGRCVIVYLSMISEMNGDHQLVWCEKQGIRNDSEVLIDKIRMSLAQGPRVIGYKWL